MTKEECALLWFIISFSVVPEQKREDLCWRQTSAVENISPLFIVIFGPLINHPRRNHPPTAPHAHFCCFSLLPHVQKSCFGFFWSLGRSAPPWVMCLWWGLWTNAPRHPSINSSVALICSGSARGRATHVSRAPILCFLQRFIAASTSICLSLRSLWYTLLVSIKYLSAVDRPPALCLFVGHLYAAWDHFGNGQPFHGDQAWRG